jgi:hypothetical protein
MDEREQTASRSEKRAVWLATGLVLVTSAVGIILVASGDVAIGIAFGSYGTTDAERESRRSGSPRSC